MPFLTLFEALTGSKHFPWQEAMFAHFVSGEKLPQAAVIPTGLGKTSVVAIWLIALLLHPDKVARRLVYVVNRRTVVDQTTAEVERLRANLLKCPELLVRLNALCAVPAEMPLALSTLRGQFADNREWSIDPTRPAVIVGTVDMIGSGLLFNRYTCGFKLRPHHAAFLGQDALLVHDEAHLEPAFQKLLETIVKEQGRCNDWRPLHVLQLTATARGVEAPFVLTPKDETDDRVARRLNSCKNLHLIPISDEKTELAATLIERALARCSSGRAILIFARTVESVQKVAEGLKAHSPIVLTGTMRGEERDALVSHEVFKRFLPSESQSQDTKARYLVATSAGEVGVNISADDLICDLSTYESMAQRFGRVNRFGNLSDSVIEVIHPEGFKNTDPEDSKFDPIESARQHTLGLLQDLHGDASPNALRKLKQQQGAQEFLNAFTPDPEMRPATDILFDAWSMTSIREPLPGRPPIAPYLHGEAEWQPPETLVAWRSEVEVIKDGLEEIYNPEELLSECPLKPHELLRAPSYRVREELAQMVKRLGDEAAAKISPWIVSGEGEVSMAFSLTALADKENEDELYDVTLLLPPSIGGLSPSGLLEGKAEAPDKPITLDIASIVDGPGHKIERVRVWSDSQDIPEEHSDLRLKLVIDTLIQKEDSGDSEDDEVETKKLQYWLWLEAPLASGADSTRNHNAVSLADHVEDVVGHARQIVFKLGLSESLSRCVILAAQIHDLGKSRRYWQQGIGNHDKSELFAKSGKHPATGRELRPRPALDLYRHELGSLLDVEVPGRLKQLGEEIQQNFVNMTTDEKDVILHLVAAHHGRARPHFPVEESFDPEAVYDDVQTIVAEVPQRYARLQRRFGRWGLAYIESLLRSADYAASAEIKPLPFAYHV